MVRTAIVDVLVLLSFFSTQTLVKSWQPKPTPTPTPGDQAFSSWAKSVGIFSPLLTCLTTTESVGGRGLFATASIQPGTILASIPQSLFIYSWDRQQWCADITQQVKDLDSKDQRKEWVDSWSGGGCTTWDEAVTCAGDTKIDANLETKVRKQLDKRKEEWEMSAAKYDLDPETDFGTWSLVSSRACFLGPSWTNEDGTNIAIGMVPLFDMLNHFPENQNVDLISVGSAFDRMQQDSAKPKDLKERDMLLMATKTIQKGEELFTDYLDESDVNVVKARKLVQWGFL